MSQRSDNIEEFREEFKTLILKYRPNVSVIYDPYEQIDCIEITLGDKIAVTIDGDLYDFGDELKPLDDVK